MLTCRVCIFVFLSEKGANKQPIVVKIPVATAVRTGQYYHRFRMGDFSVISPERPAVIAIGD
jgi:hypothetical protein